MCIEARFAATRCETGPFCFDRPFSRTPHLDLFPLGLTGRETFDIQGVSEGLEPHAHLTVVARTDDGHETKFSTLARLDSDVDVEYYRNGGILHTVLRRIALGEM